MNGVNFSLDVIQPLQTVANSRRVPSRQVEYLKIEKLENQREIHYLICTSNKSEATSLKILSESFQSSERGSLGHRLHTYFADQGKYGREEVDENKKEMLEAIQTIAAYEETRCRTFKFKLISILSKCFCLADSPKRSLQERMLQLQAIENKIRAEYNDLPTKTQVELDELSQQLRTLEDQHKALIQILAYAEETIDRIKAITENHQELHYLSEEDDKEITVRLRNVETQISKSFLFAKEQMVLEVHEQRWLETLKNKNFDSGLHFRVRLALVRIKHLRLLIAKEKIDYEKKREALQIEMSALENGKVKSSS